MFLLDSDSQLDCLSNLLEAGCAVNSTGDPSGQSPAHLAACGGQAFCLLWLLQTGADANLQDSSGETPIHKAARAGSLECISVLIASDAQLEICNHDGKTAEDLAWTYGYLECGKYLSTLRMNRSLKHTAPAERVSMEMASGGGTAVGQKRTCDFGVVPDRKRVCDW
ncbi:ankyrin repeat domain-containing protein 37 [Anguilla rostrata]|uniref:Ankyrin repeat domain-containing protein 37 n=1 Tax=Anguilla anguilla TaxID=7936 RepID=A0A9D3MLA6_ANGAN|nr:ankyrin repeat domain-containing protein 37 [Anguilla anguilla]KAG5848318.1 hypothetical protein ANANG_G00097220 [Anguilla anguilla]